MNNQVTSYIQQAPEEQRKIMDAVRQLIHESVNDVQEEFKWSRPVFRKGQDFAYLKIASTYVTLGFFQYQKLDDPDHLLEGSGKDMRHIKLKKAEDINSKLLRKWFIDSVV